MGCGSNHENDQDHDNPESHHTTIDKIHDHKLCDVKIACVSFAFANTELIGLLKKRGRQLINGQFESSIATKRKIYEKMFDKSKAEEYERPVMAFVTFINQEGYERCIQNFETSNGFFGNISSSENGKRFKLYDQTLECVAAPDPSDIIWEN